MDGLSVKHPVPSDVGATHGRWRHVHEILEGENKEGQGDTVGDMGIGRILMMFDDRPR